MWLVETSSENTGSSEDLRIEPLIINDEPDEQERVRLATDDRSLPVLDIRYGSHAFGANAGVELERHLLVDFRRPIPRVIAFLARPLLTHDRLKILLLTVTEGSGRGVYLVGVDFSGPQLTADTLLIATDAPTYDACNAWMLPATSVALNVRTEPFTALLSISAATMNDELRRATSRLG